MDSAQAGDYSGNGGTITYANHTNHANPSNYANLVTQANQIPDHESFTSENNTRTQTTVNTYTNAGYYDLAVNPSDQNSHRIPSEYNAIALKQQPNEYSSHSQVNSAQHQYYDIQNSGTGLAVAVSPNIPNAFDQNYCTSTTNNSDPTATCYNTYSNSNYYDVYPNCTSSAITNNEFNFINIANEFASPEYYQLS